MDELLHVRYQHCVDCLAQSSYAQVIAYLQTLHARAYAPDKLYAVAGAVKKFVLLLPAPRRELLSGQLTQSEPRDIDTFIAAARSAGLAPSTINNKLSLLREFFAS